jgi:LPXTG-motif cell wall-anchored protein
MASESVIIFQQHHSKGGSMRWNSMRLLVIMALLVGMLPLSAAFAQDAATTGEVIAEGLNGPMGVLVDPNGDIWVIDSGLGGEEVIDMLSPETGQPVTATVGLSARIVKISAADSAMTDVASVVSIASPGGASGGARLALLDGELYATVSDWYAPAELDPPAGVATVVKVGSDGEVTELVQSWPFERDNNPDGRVLHAHPYGILAGPDGMLWVTEAGGNNLQRIDPVTGEVEVVAVFEPLPGVFPRPEYDNELLTDAVPTGVAVKDGGVYVSLLSGAPFIPGNAKVLAVAEDGTVSDYATGLTMLTDLRTGPDGELYAVQFSVNTEQGPVPNSGAVIRVKEGDASEVAIAGLSFPTSVDFDADGNAYVSVNGVGAPGSGQVLKFAGATDMTTMTVAEMMASMAAPPAEEAPAEETAAESAETAESGPADIVDTAVAAGNFTTLISAVQAKGLEDALRAEGPYTVFAPTNAAFDALPLSDRIALYSDPDALTQTLLYHVLAQKLMAADITDGLEVETLQGGTLKFSVVDGVVMVNDAKIDPADVEATNGVIHVIDKVLSPTAAAEEMAASEEMTATEEVAAGDAMTVTGEVVSSEAMTATEEVAAGEAMTVTGEVVSSEAMTATEEVAASDAMTATEEVVAGDAMTVTGEVVSSEAMTMTEEVAASDAMTATTEAPAATEEIAETAPEALPETGGEAQSSAPFVVALLVMIVVAGVAFFSRKRIA